MKLKQLSFVFFGLAIIGLGLFFGRSHLANASLKEGQKFDDWTVGCNKLPDNKTTCFLRQQVTVMKDDKPQVLAFYQVGFLQKNKLSMLQVVPLGVALQAGTSIIADSQLIAPGKFTICTAEGCQAIAEITKKNFQAMLSSSKTEIAFLNNEGKQVQLPLSTKGLKEGIEALKQE